MKHLITTVVFLICLSTTINAQSPYRYSYNKQAAFNKAAPVVVTTVALTGLSILAYKTQENFVPAGVGVLFVYGAWNIYHDPEFKNKKTWVYPLMVSVGCGLIQAFVVKPDFSQTPRKL